MRSAVYTVYGIAALLLTSAPLAAQDWAPVVAQTSPGVLRLESTDGKTSGFCSVVVIDKARGFAVTAAHCVPLNVDARSLAIAQRDVSVLRLNRVLDLAILKIDKLHKLKAVVNVAVRSTDAPIGTPVAILGYALGAETLKAQFGHVAETASPLVGSNLLSDAQVFTGDSGGAVIDAQGQLVAITSGYVGSTKAPNAFAIGSNSDALRLFVEDYAPAPTVTK